VLANQELRDRFEVVHCDTSDHREAATIGRWDLQNILIALKCVWQFGRALRGPRGTVYLPLSQSSGGFLRDSLFIHLAAARGWRVAVHLRGGEFDGFYARQPAPLRWWIRRTLRQVHSIAVMGESLRHLFDGLIPRARVVVVPNGTPEPAPQPGERDWRRGLFLSNLWRRKGLLKAVEAAVLVARRSPDARFTFVGEWESEEVELAARGLAQAADGRIVFLPKVVGVEKDALLAQCGFLLFPPVEPEGHPRVVLEALAAALPVITTDRGTIAETVIDGESGFVLPEPDPQELAARMLVLIEDEERWLRMSKAARARYLACYTQAQADSRLAQWLVEVQPAEKSQAGERSATAHSN
jgi:glycosyltransferase involved in cell wall biosynthesis